MKKKSYKFRKGFRNPAKLDPVSVWEHLNKTCEEHDRELWPEKTVESARPKSSPIHGHFEWSDKKAAHEYRLEQARDLHRSIIVVQVDEDSGDEVEERAFIHVRTSKAAPYRPVEDVLSDDELKEQARHAAVKELFRAKRRLDRWHDFADASTMIESVISELSSAKTQVGM